MLPNKPVSEITASDIKTLADWNELCQKEFDRQQAEAAGDEFARPETLEMIKSKFGFLKPLETDPVIVKEPTLADLKSGKLAELNAAFHTACKKPFVFTAEGWRADANEDANRNVKGLIDKLEMTGEDTAVFRDYDNIERLINLAGLKALYLQIIEKGQQLYAVKWQYRTQIEQAGTGEALNGIRIAF